MILFATNVTDAYRIIKPLQAILSVATRHITWSISLALRRDGCDTKTLYIKKKNQ